MNKKNFKSIFLISLGGVGVWLLGFALIWILDFENSSAVNKGWLLIALIGTLILSIVKNMKNDER